MRLIEPSNTPGTGVGAAGHPAVRGRRKSVFRHTSDSSADAVGAAPRLLTTGTTSGQLQPESASPYLTRPPLPYDTRMVSWGREQVELTQKYNKYETAEAHKKGTQHRQASAPLHATSTPRPVHRGALHFYDKILVYRRVRGLGYTSRRRTFTLHAFAVNIDKPSWWHLTVAHVVHMREGVQDAVD